MQKPAREQGRNNRLGRYALANAQASAIIFQLPPQNVKIKDSYRNESCGVCV